MQTVDEQPQTRRARREQAERSPARADTVQAPLPADADAVALRESDTAGKKESGGKKQRRAKPRRRVTFFGVVGELFITLGLVVLLYVAWQMWIGDAIYGAEANAEGQDISEQWQQQYESAPTPPPSETDAATPEPAWVEPVILPQPADAETFALMRIPRLGPDYSFPIAGGTTRARTLDTVRIGHYTDAAMPGEVGNFALAGHRTTFGAPFNRLAELRIGDAIVIESPDGWYTYRFRTLEYVKPSAVDVLLPVPRKPDVPAGERYITLTSCSPMYAMTERIVAYGLFESFTPRAGGPPTALIQAAA